jgi:hypothetical protein
MSIIASELLPVITKYVVIPLSLVLLGAGVSWKVTSNHYEAKENKESKVALSIYQDKVKQLAELGTKYEAAKNEQRIIYRTIEKKVQQIVERPVYRNECVDDDGLRIITEALTARSDTSKHADGVPVINAVRGQDGG